MNDRAREIYDELIKQAEDVPVDGFTVNIISRQVHAVTSAVAVQLDDLETRLAEALNRIECLEEYEPAHRDATSV